LHPFYIVKSESTRMSFESSVLT